MDFLLTSSIVQNFIIGPPQLFLRFMVNPKDND